MSYPIFLKFIFDCDEGAHRAPSSQSNIFKFLEGITYKLIALERTNSGYS
jgi:hypothetical protein